MAKRILLRIGDYIFVLRPLILIPAWSFYLLGTKTGMSQSDATSYGSGFAYGLVCLTCILITAYLINQIFDQKSDRLNDKGHFLTRGIFRVRTVLILAMVFFVTASLTFRRTADAQQIPLAVALVLSLTYSLPPLRLCARPFVDLLANAIGYGGVAFMIGYAAFEPSLKIGFLHSVPYVLLVGATFLHTTILDIDGDRDSGKITTSVTIGVKNSALLAAVLAAIGCAWSFAVSWRDLGDAIAPAVMSVGAVVFAVGFIRGRSRESWAGISSISVQLATLVVTIPAAVFEPLYLLLVVPLVLVSRYYYRARFNLGYPGPNDSARDA